MPKNLLVTLAALLLLAGATLAHSDEGGASYYGFLQIPQAYFNHEASNDPLNHVQPGSVVLTNGNVVLRAPVQRDGTFTFYHVPYGAYVLEASYHDFQFPNIRVDVQFREGDKGERIPVIRTSTNDFAVTPLDGTGVEEDSPAVIPVIGVHSYYFPREQYSIGMLLKNPMILMMLVSVGLMGLMKLFPEEEMKESRRMTKEWGNKMNKMAKGVQERREAINAKN